MDEREGHRREWSRERERDRDREAERQRDRERAALTKGRELEKSCDDETAVNASRCCFILSFPCTGTNGGARRASDRGVHCLPLQDSKRRRLFLRLGLPRYQGHSQHSQQSEDNYCCCLLLKLLVLHGCSCCCCYCLGLLLFLLQLLDTVARSVDVQTLILSLLEVLLLTTPDPHARHRVVAGDDLVAHPTRPFSLNTSSTFTERDKAHISLPSLIAPSQQV